MRALAPRKAVEEQDDFLLAWNTEPATSLFFGQPSKVAVKPYPIRQHADAIFAEAVVLPIHLSHARRTGDQDGMTEDEPENLLSQPVPTIEPWHAAVPVVDRATEQSRNEPRGDSTGK